MSLLILIYTLLGTLAPLAGVPQVAELVEPEPGGQELVLEVQSQHPLDSADQQRMETALQQRFAMIGLSQTALRREGETHYVVQIPGAMALQLAELPAMQSELEQLLNERMTLQLLCVHPHSDRLLSHSRVRDAIDDYERAMSRYESGGADATAAPELPPLPEILQLPDYMLAEQPVMSSDDASGHYEYLVLQRPEIAAEAECLVDESVVESVRVRPSGVDITFTPEGAESLFELTRNMRMGQDRLAIVLGGTVISAPVVHAPLRRSVHVSGLSAGELELLASGFCIPLPASVRIVELRTPRR